MKDKTITVRVPDFCPEDCREFEIHESRGEYLGLDDGTLVHSERTCTCENEWHCRRLYEQLKTRQCAECREEMSILGSVVRCGDCKHSYLGNWFNGYACRFYGNDSSGNPKIIKNRYGYCEKGEKKARGDV